MRDSVKKLVTERLGPSVLVLGGGRSRSYIKREKGVLFAWERGRGKKERIANCIQRLINAGRPSLLTVKKNFFEADDREKTDSWSSGRGGGHSIDDHGRS